MENHNFYMAIILTLLAGMSTLVGGFLTFFVKKNDLRVLSIGLGFSAGVMVFVSLTEILPGAEGMLSINFTTMEAKFGAFIAFFIGVMVAVLIDVFIPDHIESGFEGDPNHCTRADKHRIKRAGLITAMAVALHNFPEGMATFLITTQDLTLGASVAVAIAIHNIPEGIAVALPIYHVTGKKRYAILYSFLSGIAEPVGGLLGFFLLKTILPQSAVGLMFALVAGIMVYLSFDTLLPLAREYGENHHVIIGIMAGMFVIGLSLILM